MSEINMSKVSEMFGAESSEIKLAANVEVLMKGGAVTYKGIPIGISAPAIKCKICGDKAEDADQQQFTIRESGNVIATCEKCYDSIMFDEED